MSNSPPTATLSPAQRREHARRIWQAGVNAVQPAQCVPAALRQLRSFPPLASFDRVIVVGGGKAGAAMSLALETALPDFGVKLSAVEGWVNVPRETVIPTKKIHLHAARPMGINHPTDEAVQGTQEIYRLVDRAGANDLLLCVLSGGGSALLCAPVPGITLTEKQVVTKLLHQCGASIAEMNAVRKHLSLIKGGGLAKRFFQNGIGQRRLISLIISDVIGDPRDVIASGPTSVDPTTFAEALTVLNRHGLREKVPASVREYLEQGAAGERPETLKEKPRQEGHKVMSNRIIASNTSAIDAASREAATLGYGVVNLGDRIAGDTQTNAQLLVALIRQMDRNVQKVSRSSPLTGQAKFTGPYCLLGGGETTVRLDDGHGLGGRNQEMALAYLVHAGSATLQQTTFLCGGTDGEDGPTDAAGAFADTEVLRMAKEKGLDAREYLRRHDAYPFFAATDSLLKTGLTNTNVMDLRVLLDYPS